MLLNLKEKYNISICKIKRCKNYMGQRWVEALKINKLMMMKNKIEIC